MPTPLIANQRASAAALAGTIVLVRDYVAGMLVAVDQPNINTGIARFKNVGWYAAGGVFEEWITTGVPGTVPPSGHTLTNVQHYPI